MADVAILSGLLAREFGIPFVVQATPRNSRMTMRFDSLTRVIRLRVWPRFSDDAVLTFVHKHDAWVRKQGAMVAEARQTAIDFVPGAVVPVFGVNHTIRQDNSILTPAALRNGKEGPEIVVGRGGNVEARVMALLKAESLRRLTAMTREKAPLVGWRGTTSVEVKEVRSTWGKCHRDGRIFYQWRLIMAPLEIVDYVIAHEVSHLREMNHGPRFWKLCATLSGIAPDRGKAWLTKHGHTLYLHGQQPTALAA